MAKDPGIQAVQSAAFVQCVGSRIPERPYCSKLCCTHSIKNALQLKTLNPEMDVYILYRDMRSYGLREDLYKQAREAGILFLRFHADPGIDVSTDQDRLIVKLTDTGLRRKVEISPDIMILASAIIPPEENALAQKYKVALNDDGFFMEAHAKLRPVDCATDGVFICGLAHAPKPIDESVSQAAAAATKALTLLARKTIFTSGTTAHVEPNKCSECGVCVSICPYSAPSFIPADERMFPGKAKIESVLCKGCGLCVASCRSGAIRLRGFDNNQIMSQLYALGETG
jgi:heterodisulfide reductase subunit A